MNWMDRHNEKIFRKKVREELSRRFSDRNYFCEVEDELWMNLREVQIYRLKISFSYMNATLTLRVDQCSEYSDYENETVRSACDKIVERIKSYCWKFSSERVVCDRSHFAVDFLASHILEIMGKVE